MDESQASWLVQGRDEMIVDTAPARIWRILKDTQRLSEWMPAVKHSDGRGESMGAVRSCEVNFEGRKGKVVERCVVYDEPRRIGWLLQEDSLGFSRMLRHFSFDFVLEPMTAKRTRLVSSSYFEPRNWIAQLMVTLVIRRKFRALRRQMLANIKRLAESEMVV